MQSALTLPGQRGTAPAVLTATDTHSVKLPILICVPLLIPLLWPLFVMPKKDPLKPYVLGRGAPFPTPPLPKPFRLRRRLRRA